MRGPVSCKPGSQLYSTSHSYVVQSILGKGTFGEVVKCIRNDNKKTVVVKMIKDEIPLKDAIEEVTILDKLRSLAPFADSFVWLNHSFKDQGRLCLEFDLLDISLWDLMKKRHFMPLSLQDIRPIILQLATGLQYLKTFGIIHADLKPGNIMMVNHRWLPHRVKIIDFGLAHDVSNAITGSHVQSLAYRSPEIMLGLPYTEAIDMWSLGCVAAHLYLGFYLFCGKDEYQMMTAIVKILSQPPDHLLKSGLKTKRFFTISSKQQWRLKTPEEFYIHSVLDPTKRELRMKLLDDLSKQHRRNFSDMKLLTLDDVFEAKLVDCQSTAEQITDMNDLRRFVDLMERMLKLSAAARITPCQQSLAPKQTKVINTHIQVRNRLTRKTAEDEKYRGTWTLNTKVCLPGIPDNRRLRLNIEDSRHRLPPISRPPPSRGTISRWILPLRKQGPSQCVPSNSYISGKTHEGVRHHLPPIGRANMAQ